MAVLQPLVEKKEVDIVLNQSANFATDVAQTTMTAELAKTTDIQLVVCGNDAMALGVINALKTHGITPGQKTLVVGADAQPESLDAVKAGTQLDTVTHSPFVEAYWAVEAMQNVLKNGTKPTEAKFPHGDVIIPMTLVDKANVDKIAAGGTPKEFRPCLMALRKVFKRDKREVTRQGEKGGRRDERRSLAAPIRPRRGEDVRAGPRRGRREPRLLSRKRWSASSATTAPANRPSSRCSPASIIRTPAASSIAAARFASARPAPPGPISRSR